MWPLVLVAITATPPALSADVEDPWRSKGTFGNDTWLPHDVALERILAAADEALEADGNDAKPEDVFGAWDAALEEAAPGAWVRWDTRMHWESTDEVPPLWSDRRTEGLFSAILLRQAAAGGALHLPWNKYIEGAADAALEAALALPVERAYRPLASLSARYPGSRASARAALYCCEWERERGREHHARAWLARAKESAALLKDEALNAAVLARIEEPPAREHEPWERADSWEVVDFALLTDDLGSPASGVRGLTRWGEEGVFIQSAELAWTLGTRGSAQAISLRGLAERAGQPLARRWMRPGSKWRHQPTVHDEVVFSVLGRARNDRSNALIAFEAGDIPLPRWSLGQGGWRDSKGELLARLADAIGPGAWEFQPGPLVVDDLLIVQARRWELSDSNGRLSLVDPARAEATALALELTSGALVWKAALARGSELFGDPGARFSTAEIPSRSAPSPRLCGSSLVFATGLGACVALDLADGRAQRAVLGQRVEGGIPWAQSAVATNPLSSIWTPYGGETAYEIALGTGHPDLFTSPFTSPPERASEWSSLVGAHDERLLVAVSRRGRHQIELVGESAHRSVQLSPGETLQGAHALGSARLLSVSDQGLFVFDLERELYLVGHVPLDPSVTCLPAGLVAAGSWAWALTEAGLYRLRIRDR
jgi:hypothetical protein